VKSCIAENVSFEMNLPLYKKERKSFVDTKVTALILAGGRGERLYPLTNHRTKPAVPFGGMCRLIDFVLSNMVNSGIHRIYILTQYKAHSLLCHLQQMWAITHPMNGYHLVPVPAQMRGRDTWYLGTADAVYQNIDLLRRDSSELVLVFGSDHVYSMNIRQMIEHHLENKAEVSVATIPTPVEKCASFGTVSVNGGQRIVEFMEKRPDPKPLPGRRDQALVSMGNYIFNRNVLLEELFEDAFKKDSTHDFGRDILPGICKRRRVLAYDFRQNTIPGSAGSTDYWRDVGTIESYYHANMDLNNPLARLNLYNSDWPLRSVRYHIMPSRITEDRSGKRGCVENSILGGSTVVSGGYVRDSVIGNNVLISSGARVEESVILGDVTVKEGASIRRAIIDHGNLIRPGERIGYDKEEDSSRYYMDSSGIVVVPHRYPYDLSK
jgi:glucose-1-phosphate adenylyltransferase